MTGADQHREIRAPVLHLRIIEPAASRVLQHRPDRRIDGIHRTDGAQDGHVDHEAGRYGTHGPCKRCHDPGVMGHTASEPRDSPVLWRGSPGRPAIGHTAVPPSGKLPRMEQQTFEWDVLAHPTLIEWFDALRDVGWYRDPSIPGVKTPHGTIEYSFHYLAHEDELGA